MTLISKGAQVPITRRLGRRRFLQTAACAVAIPSMSRIAIGEDYPVRPINMIVPFGPAGPIDILARFLVERMRPALGQPIIVENVIGASDSIGVGRVAHAAANVMERSTRFPMMYSMTSSPSPC